MHEALDAWDASVELAKRMLSQCNRMEIQF